MVIGQQLNASIQQRSLASARTAATLIVQAGVQPLLTPQELTDGLTLDEIGQINDRLAGAALSDQERRLKVWNRAGTVVYSDNPALIGRTFPIDDDLRAALQGIPAANITDGHDEENSGDNLPGPLIQVYVPIVFRGNLNPSGAFEIYLPYAPVQAAIDSDTHQLYFVLALGLSLFYVSMFPIVALAERWRRRAEATALANLAAQQQLNRLKSQFLVRISHQFRTALVGIEGFSEVMRDAETLDLDEVKAFATDIHSDAEKLDQAFGRILALDDMEAGRVTLEKSPVDINRLAREVAERAQKQARAAVINVVPDPGSPIVDCDDARIQQLLSIVIDNAIRYSPAGSQVDVAIAMRVAEIEVTVSDRGPGMAADDSVPTGSANGNGGAPVPAGTGLGIPIARQIVRLHGGRLWINSKPGQGTQVHFTLPVATRVAVQA